ncbi:MAG: helix-turn-helix domain-containing protein [Ruminococcaceae bacterium]|nr:helix-turn-helix domain-containing protein [Oscillospiraceae bacterium]
MTGIKSVLYDADMNCIFGHPYSMCDFCRTVRKDRENYDKCIKCDRTGFERCRATGETVIYKCHMGLTEAATPILDNGVIIGYFLFGQLLSENSRDSIKEKIENGNFSDKDLLISYLDAIPVTDDKVIHASARLISMCASYVHLKNILNLEQENISVHIGKYIAESISDPKLSISSLCSYFSFSRGTLYNISKKSFGMGITEYIRKLRIKKAIELIENGKDPIYKISEKVGISDPNYLTKLIKEETGETPKRLQMKKRSYAKKDR